MIAALPGECRSAWCFCGRTQVARPCLFHGGDLESRVDRVMRALRVVDTEHDADLSGGPKWLALVCASIAWHLLPWVRRGDCAAIAAMDAGKLLGDLAIGITADVWEARQAITAEELAALHAEAVMGRWPWAGAW